MLTLLFAVFLLLFVFAGCVVSTWRTRQEHKRLVSSAVSPGDPLQRTVEFSLEQYDDVSQTSVELTDIVPAIGWQLPRAFLAALFVGAVAGKRQGCVIVSRATGGPRRLSSKELTMLPTLRVRAQTVPSALTTRIFLQRYGEVVYGPVKVAGASSDLLAVTAVTAEVPALFLVATVSIRTAVALAPSSYLAVAPYGLIHIATKVDFFARDLLVRESLPRLEFTSFSTPLRSTDRGIELDFVQEFFLDTVLVVRCQETLLSRDTAKQNSNCRRQTAEYCRPKLSQVVSVFDIRGNGLGRDYAQVTGDWNPHHVSPVLAKMLGFKGCIAHGLLTAEVVTQLLQNAGKMPPATRRYSMEITYKTPLYFPATGLILYQRANNDFRLETNVGLPLLDLRIVTDCH